MNKILFSLLVGSSILISVEANGQMTGRERDRRAGVLPPTATYSQPAPASQQSSRLANPSSGLSNPSQRNPVAAPSGPNSGPVSMPTNPTNLGQPSYTGSTSIPQNPFSAGQQSSTPFAPAPAAGYGTEGRYAAAGVQAPRNTAIPQNPFAAGQSTFRPPQAATFGQASRPQSTMKPFDDVPPPSVYSPYMYLYGGRNGGMDNYNMYVRPIQQQRQYDARMRREVNTLQQTLTKQQDQMKVQNQQLQQWSAENANSQTFQPLPAQDENPQGGSPYFMNQYQQYFNTRGNAN